VKRLLPHLCATMSCVSLVWGTSVGAQTPTAAKVHKNLEMSVTGITRATSVGLGDCPPGSNSVRSTARGAEEFAVVTLKVKVLPGYKPGPLQKPTLTDGAGKTYNTAVSFVDIGKVPEFSCEIPFRVPLGTTFKSVTVDQALTIDVSGVEPKK